MSKYNFKDIIYFPLDHGQGFSTHVGIIVGISNKINGNVEYDVQGVTNVWKEKAMMEKYIFNTQEGCEECIMSYYIKLGTFRPKTCTWVHCPTLEDFERAHKMVEIENGS